MMYILDQRLRAQNVAEEKAQKGNNRGRLSYDRKIIIPYELGWNTEPRESLAPLVDRADTQRAQTLFYYTLLSVSVVRQSDNNRTSSDNALIVTQRHQHSISSPLTVK